MSLSHCHTCLMLNRGNKPEVESHIYSMNWHVCIFMRSVRSWFFFLLSMISKRWIFQKRWRWTVRWQEAHVDTADSRAPEHLLLLLLGNWRHLPDSWTNYTQTRLHEQSSVAGSWHDAALSIYYYYPIMQYQSFLNLLCNIQQFNINSWCMIV